MVKHIERYTDEILVDDLVHEQKNHIKPTEEHFLFQSNEEILTIFGKYSFPV